MGHLRESWVLKTEKTIKFGAGEKWSDVEADEATFGKKIVNGQLHWEQWCGIVQRGKPQTLVLHRLKPLASKLRAPGPGAVKSGTQIIDRSWRYLKDRLRINQNVTVGSRLLRIQLRSAQYEYWLRGHDLWIETGSLVKWFMAKP